jgi:hypothetical protein
MQGRRKVKVVRRATCFEDLSLQLARDSTHVLYKAGHQIICQEHPAIFRREDDVAEQARV